MNKCCYDVLLQLKNYGFENQRLLAEKCDYSLGGINKALAQLKAEEYISCDYLLTKKGIKKIEDNSPENAVILAAGRGMRMVPINLENPKALVEVKGKALIEHQIEQLHAVGVNEIYIIVGFLKENFEYLIDKYDVKLIVNMDYDKKNNLASLAKAADFIGNTYIVPCDLWCVENPYSKTEAYSWYMMSNEADNSSGNFVNKKMQVVKSKKTGQRMIGISYISKNDSRKFIKKLKSMATSDNYDDCFWEEACYDDNKMLQFAKVVDGKKFVEINTYENLRSIDSDSDHLKSDTIDIIKFALECENKDIVDIKTLKKGMTNRSFLFSCKGKRYIMRIPGEGTNKLISRKQEAQIYKLIKNKGICDNVIYIDSSNGYKITEYIENARACDSLSESDLKLCMKKLKELHSLDIEVDNIFDLFDQIEFYETLREGKPSLYRDYAQTKENIFKLKEYIDSLNIEKRLVHIDAIPDNFLIYKDGDKEIVRLIDWEYSAMQDPHLDLAMFSVYSFYDKKQIDKLIDIYFDGKCKEATRIKIYCYVAICGLLWSNWCEYKLMLGVEFGEYSIRQYRYAKEYYRIATAEMKKEKGNE